MKIAFRTDDDGLMVRVYLALLDGTEKFEFASINRRMLTDIPDAWPRWKALMSELGCFAIEAATGQKIDGTTDFHPSDLESLPQG